MNLQTLIVGALATLAALAGSFFLGRWTAPPPPTPIADSIAPVLQQHSATRYVEKTITRTKRIVVAAPDGTTTTTDETEREEERVSENETKTPPPPEVVERVARASAPPQPQWRVGAGVGLTFTSNFGIVPVYSLEADRVLVGPLSAGVRLHSSFSAVSPFTATAVLGVSF